MMKKYFIILALCVYSPVCVAEHDDERETHKIDECSPEMDDFGEDFDLDALGDLAEKNINEAPPVPSKAMVWLRKIGTPLLIKTLTFKVWCEKQCNQWFGLCPNSDDDDAA